MNRSAPAKTRVLEIVLLIVHPSGWDTFVRTFMRCAAPACMPDQTPHPPEGGYGVHLNITHGSLCAPALAAALSRCSLNAGVRLRPHNVRYVEVPAQRSTCDSLKGAVAIFYPPPAR